MTRHIHKELIAELQSAVQAASRDYFLWTEGRILWDDGAEFLIQAYAARGLFSYFGSLRDVTIRTERPIRDLQPDAKGERFDLTIDFAKHCTYAIECKLYANRGSIEDDVHRLRAFARASDRRGLLVVPWYIGSDNNHSPKGHDWAGSGLKWHTGPKRALPRRFLHPRRYHSDRGVVIEVAKCTA